MPDVTSQIQHHQRILITGPRAQIILEGCRKVLNAQNRPYDILTDKEESLNQGPIVFITSDKFTDFNPHIVLVDSVPSEYADKFEALVGGLPKSGTLVFNGSDESAKKIGNKELEDVHKEEYTGTDVSSAVKKLVRRIGIPEEVFDKSI